MATTQKPTRNVTATDLGFSNLERSLKSLSRTALKVKRDRDELLEALRALLDITPMAKSSDDAVIHAQAHDAIARAESD